MLKLLKRNHIPKRSKSSSVRALVIYSINDINVWIIFIVQEVDDIKGVKSQIVDDVLDILIKNGELPASAAQDPYPPSLDLHELGLEMEPLDMHDVESMDLGDNLPSSELMDVDTDWLESLINPTISSSPSTSHDPMLQQDDPFDIFNIDDNDFRMADFGWDRVDFATQSVNSRESYSTMGDFLFFKITYKGFENC